MIKNQGFLRKIFKSYAIFIVISLSVFVALGIVFFGIIVNDKIVDTQNQLLENINVNIDRYFGEIDDFSLFIADSDEFKRIALQELPQNFKNGKRTTENFTELYTIASKMFIKNYMINIQSNDGIFIFMGSNYLVDYTSSEYIRGKLGEIEISYIEADPELSKLIYLHPNSSSDLIPVINFSRAINMKFSNYIPNGRLNIQVPYSVFTKRMEQIIQSNFMNISVYNRSGQKLYGDSDTNLYKYRLQDGFLQGEHIENGLVINIQQLQSSKLYVVASYQMLEMYNSLILYAVFVFLAFIILIILLLLITYRISKNISEPINKLCFWIGDIALSTDESEILSYKASDIKELDLIYDSIFKMQAKLNNSLKEIVNLHVYEIQSKLIALQAQMQPHFLYNTLMMISTMAEDNDNNAVSKTCANMTKMLRYISTGSAKGVTLLEELNYLKSYIEIMKQRFANLNVEIDLPLEMMMVEVPKLSVQPLVENSLKYSENTDCSIKICGKIKNEKWIISISDNGPGITREKKEEIMQKCMEALDNNAQNLQIDGMGIANIYIRLKLFYSSDFHFNIIENEDKGCTIEIGGLLKRDTNNNETYNR